MRSSTPIQSRRRATVLIMVVGVLAMLFIIGSTLLVVSRFERQTVEQKILAVTRAKGSEFNADSLLQLLRLEVVGLDGIPYNAGWHADGVANSGDVFVGEKYATILGYLDEPDHTTDDATLKAGNFPNYVTRIKNRLRGGNLLLATNEPHWTGSVYSYFAMSSSSLFSLPNASLAKQNQLIPSSNWGQPKFDADGEGVPDSGIDTDANSIVDAVTVDTGDNQYNFRIVSNGAKVLLDPLTSPALLAQVIHPQDLATQSVNIPSDLFNLVQRVVDFEGSANGSSSFLESGLAKRWLLPGNTSQSALTGLNSDDIRQALAFTLGYRSETPFTSSDWTPHWGQIDPNRTITGKPDTDWWVARVAPPAAFTDTATTYSVGGDVYDRRHLLTTLSNDDILRPRRDENRLKDFQINAAVDPLYSAGGPEFFDIVNPSASATSPVCYGTVPQSVIPATGVVQWGTVFNQPLAPVQMSLRDLLREMPVDSSNAGNQKFFFDTSNNPVSQELSAELFTAATKSTTYYRRAMQLTAYYLAMIQHSTVQGSDKPSKSSDPLKTATLPPTALPVTADFSAQLNTAAQLAINTIDFADTDDVPTHFKWTGKDPTGAAIGFDVAGVERQPYITELYVKIALKPQAIQPDQWDTTTPINLYAVELYNPYEVPIDLSAYALRPITSAGDAIMVGGPPKPLIVQLSGFLQPYSYKVIANTATDPATGAPLQSWSGIIASDITADIEKYDASASQLIIPAAGGMQLVRSTYVDCDLTTGFTQMLTADLTVAKGGILVDQMLPADDLPAGTGGDFGLPPYDPAKDKYVDDPANPGGINPCPPSVGFTIRRPGKTVTGTAAEDPNGVIISDATTDRLVRDSSLQRHKEPSGLPPRDWHFTISRQMTLPLRPYEVTDQNASSGGCTAVLTSMQSRRVQHCLLGTDSMKGYVPSGWSTAQTLPGNRDVITSEFRGLDVPVISAPLDATGQPLVTAGFFAAKAPIAGVPVICGRALPESPHPYPANYSNEWYFTVQDQVAKYEIMIDTNASVNGFPPGTLSVYDAAGNSILINTTSNSFTVTNSAGSLIHVKFTPGTVTGNGFRIKQIRDAVTLAPLTTLAFPTTGSLLLVSRYAHDVTTTRSASVAAAHLDITVAANRLKELQKLDNGHLPLFDSTQVCTDGNTVDSLGAPKEPVGALDTPWGQLAFNYFTALPLEELFLYRDLSLWGGATNQRVIDVTRTDVYNKSYSTLFPGLPVVEPAPAPNVTLAGPRVRGRININAAPWWVLDGLPVLSWKSEPATEIIPIVPGSNVGDYYSVSDGTTSASTSRLDYHNQVGLSFTGQMVDEDWATTRTLYNTGFGWNMVKPPLDLASLSPTFARAIEKYRELRNPSNTVLNPPDATFAQTPTYPGFLSVGQLADVLARVNYSVGIQALGVTTQYTGPLTTVNGKTGIREYPVTVGANTDRPCAYLNYLQLVTPLVRLQDWATVKDHVFTIYMTQGDTTVTPNVWTHSEMTVDRTRCYYTNDLPAKVAQTPAVSYYNVVSDSK